MLPPVHQRQNSRNWKRNLCNLISSHRSELYPDVACSQFICLYNGSVFAQRWRSSTTIGRSTSWQNSPFFHVSIMEQVPHSVRDFLLNLPILSGKLPDSARLHLGYTLRVQFAVYSCFLMTKSSWWRSDNWLCQKSWVA